MPQWLANPQAAGDVIAGQVSGTQLPLAGPQEVPVQVAEPVPVAPLTLLPATPPASVAGVPGVCGNEPTQICPEPPLSVQVKLVGAQLPAGAQVCVAVRTPVLLQLGTAVPVQVPLAAMGPPLDP